MILIPHGRKILAIAFSLFITTTSLVLFLANSGEGENGKASVLESLLRPKEEISQEVALIEDAPSLSVSASGKIVDVNRAFEIGFGYRLGDLVSKNFFSVIAPDDLAAFAQEYSAVSSSGKIHVNSGPYHLINVDGASRVVLVTLEPMHKKTGAKSSMNISFKDITEKVGDEKEGNNKASGKSIKEIDGADENSPKDGKNRIIVEKTS